MQRDTITHGGREERERELEFLAMASIFAIVVLRAGCERTRGIRRVDEVFVVSRSFRATIRQKSVISMMGCS